ncbi:MAG: hypothetical protein WD738_00800 [Pirellulales bacterium]
MVSVLYVAALSAAAGCSRVESYMVDPVVASTAAIEQYDKSGDGLLDETELKACPALLLELRAYDESNDKKLSAEEIGAQIKEMYGRGAGLTSLDCTVTMDGSPLSGATVRFIPEDFLGEEIKAAEGITNSDGNASMSIAPEELPKELRRHSFMRTGIYRVEITHPTKKIPAKYNTDTTLGFEFHRTNHIQPPTFNLASK